MKRSAVPQDHARAFMGHSKILYAEDEQGRSVEAPSNGWEVEQIVLDQALEEYERLATETLAQAREGQASALAYHMYSERMDAVLLAQSTGYPRWRVRRHLRPNAFAALSETVRQRYAEALGKTARELDSLPEQA